MQLFIVVSFPQLSNGLSSIQFSEFHFQNRSCFRYWTSFPLGIDSKYQKEKWLDACMDSYSFPGRCNKNIFRLITLRSRGYVYYSSGAVVAQPIRSEFIESLEPRASAQIQVLKNITLIRKWNWIFRFIVQRPERPSIHLDGAQERHAVIKADTSKWSIFFNKKN